MPSQSSINTDAFASLRYPEFRSYLSMRFFLTFALQMKAVLVGWFIYSLTKDPLSLGMIGLAEAIPAISIAMFGGHVADRSDKRKLLFGVICTIILAATLLFVVTLPSMQSRIDSHRLELIIYIVVFIDGLARGFFSPAAFSLMAFIVPRELYPNSTSWNSSSWQLASVVGPAVGGLIYGFFGISVTLGVVIGCMLISLVNVFMLKSRPIPPAEKEESIWNSLGEGIHFVFGNKMMLGAMTLDLFSVFFGGAVALLPIFANDILKVGAEGLGILRAAPSVGAVLTMLAMTRYSPANQPWRNLIIAVSGFGIATILFGLSTNLYLSLFFLFLTGAFDSVSVIVRSTIFQMLTPDHMRGRVSAVNSMFIGSSNEIGAFESGVTAKLFGTAPAVIFGGSMTLLIVAGTYLKTKSLMGARLIGKEIVE
ncbi:MFS transporter [Solitalea koreensis]|uniref:Transmembrane secretion effector n=1 Tax=Solitalea koreensis TaxID=543615 RepID=A0A521CGZ0_9SPHI|nr:MFS transporter [Solitalea koreensis]SMO58726.1 Transmembrane secretion effector [Solitalea koreensis]